MLIGNESHTTTAARILSSETMEQLQRDRTMTAQGWKILARWALNQPADLKVLEQKGFLVLYSMLINQQDSEINTLAENPMQGMNEQEQLELQGINTSLVISN